MTGIPSGADEGLTVRAADRALDLDDLTYLNRMTTVGQVLPGVAHELNNALQVIGGLVEMLSMRADLPQDVSDKVARIGAQSVRATEMIRELITFSRRDDAGVGPADLARLVERALGLRRYHLGRARISVTTEGCPPGEALARADGNHVVQVLLNLIINAEHSLAGRTDGRIHVRLARRGESVEIRISDNGTGVPGEVAGRVTEPFFTTKTTAAGLGLTVSAALARAQGGDLHLETASDGGTIATVTLPAVREG